jgi:hypothetical protein
MTEQTPREGLSARQSAQQAADGLPEGRGRERAAGGREGLRGSTGGTNTRDIDAELRHANEQIERLTAELSDERGAKRIAADSADRFRDVLCEVLNHPDENPGDDVLVAELRANFGKTGPEPTAWRNRLAGYEAIRDQIKAAHNAGPTVAECAEADRRWWGGEKTGEQ